MLSPFPTDRVCAICARAKATYRCPACNAPYCSLPCYKGHDGRCTEAFYAEHVKENYKIMAGAGSDAEKGADDKAEIAKMLMRDAEAREGERKLPDGGGEGMEADAMLQAAMAEAEIEEEDGGAGADLGDDFDEEKAFLRAVASGDVLTGEDALAAAHWQPWWVKAVASDANTEMPPEASTSGNSNHDCFLVKLETPLQPLSALVKARPPETTLSNNLVSILLAYCHLQRLYLGEWSDEDPCELAGLLVSLCPVLSQDARFSAPPPPHPHPTREEQVATMTKMDTEDDTVGIALAFRAYRELLAREPALRHYETATTAATTLMTTTNHYPLLSSTLVTLADVLSLLDPLSCRPDALLNPLLLKTSSNTAATRKHLVAELKETASGTESGTERDKRVERHFALDALLHCENLLGGALAAATGDSSRPVGPSAKRAKAAVLASSRKLHFFACWLNDSGNDGPEGGEQPWGLSRAGFTALVSRIRALVEKEQTELSALTAAQEREDARETGLPQKLKMKQEFGEWRKADRSAPSGTSAIASTSIFREIERLKGSKARALMGGPAKVKITDASSSSSSPSHPPSSSST